MELALVDVLPKNMWRCPEPGRPGNTMGSATARWENSQMKRKFPAGCDAADAGNASPVHTQSARLNGGAGTLVVVLVVVVLVVDVVGRVVVVVGRVVVVVVVAAVVVVGVGRVGGLHPNIATAATTAVASFERCNMSYPQGLSAPTIVLVGPFTSPEDSDAHGTVAHQGGERKDPGVWQDLLDEIDVWRSRWLARYPYPWIPNRVRRRIMQQLLMSYWITIGGPDRILWKTDSDLKIEEALWRWAGDTKMADRVARDIRRSGTFNWSHDLPRLSFRDVQLLRTGVWPTEPTDGEAAPPPDGPTV